MVLQTQLYPSLSGGVCNWAGQSLVLRLFLLIIRFTLALFMEIGEGNGNPLQYSRLETPMDGGAWWAAVHGVAKESDTTEQIYFHFSLSCIGEGNGNPL